MSNFNRNKGLGKEYAIYAPYDAERMAFLLKKARGNLSLAKFSGKTGVSQTVLYKIQHMTVNSYVKYDSICKIAEHADKNSGLTLEHFMAANGMTHANKKDITELMRLREEIDNMTGEKPVLYKPTKAEKRKKQAIYEIFGKDKIMENDHDNFILDLAYYAKDKSDEEVKKLHREKENLYKDPDAVKELSDYRIKKENSVAKRLDDIVRYFNDGKHCPEDIKETPINLPINI